MHHVETAREKKRSCPAAPPRPRGTAPRRRARSPPRRSTPVSVLAGSAQGKNAELRSCRWPGELWERMIYRQRRMRICASASAALDGGLELRANGFELGLYRLNYHKIKKSKKNGMFEIWNSQISSSRRVVNGDEFFR